MKLKKPNLKPKNRKELINTIRQLISPNLFDKKHYVDYDFDLRIIDVSLVEDFSYLFSDEKHFITYDLENGHQTVKTISFSKFNGNIKGWNTKNGKFFNGTFLNSCFNKHKLDWDFTNSKEMNDFMWNSIYDKSIVINNEKPLSCIFNGFKNSKVKNVQINKINGLTGLDDLFANTNLNEENIEMDFSFLKTMSGEMARLYAKQITGFSFNSNIDILKIPFLSDWTKKQILQQNEYFDVSFF